MTIKNDGKVGIATGSPQHALDVTGNISSSVALLAPKVGIGGINPEYGMEMKDIATGYAFMDYYSSLKEEFSVDRANLVADTANGWGDLSTWGVEENTNCFFENVDDAPGGISRQGAHGGSGCIVYYTGGAGASGGHSIFDADYFPSFLTKFQSNATNGGSIWWIGLATATSGGTGGNPSDGYFFTNNNGGTGSTTLYFMKCDASSCSSVSCGTWTINKDIVAMFVFSNGKITPYYDADLSNGLDPKACTTTTASDITALHPVIINWAALTATSSNRLDVDYVRVWQGTAE
jgi:hypothetical protein